MLSSEGNENREKTTIGLISKKINFARAAHFFFVHFCAVVLHDYNVNRLETSCMATLFMEEMSYMLLFTFFFTAAYFFLGGRYHFSFSHRRYKFMLFSLTKNGSLSLALAVCRSISAFRFRLY